MNPIEKQILINFRVQLENQWQSPPWHKRLTSALAAIWRAIAWWFTADKGETHWLWQTRLHLERCWRMPVRKGEES